MDDIQAYLDIALCKCDLIKNEKSFVKKNIANAIINLRTKKNMTQNDLSKLTNIKQSNISKIENADYNITIENLENIANAMNCNLVIKFEERK